MKNSLKSPRQKVAAAAKDTLRIIPIGGCEEVGRNMTIFEYNDDIIIVDVGVQFPEEDMPGIDYIIPNTKYLEGKEKNIRAVVFTHGHLDHIGAAPLVLEKLGNPPIVARDLTVALIKHKQEDYKPNTAKKLNVIRVKSLSDVMKFGQITVKFFQVEHSIMDSMGVILETPQGTIIHPGDWTLERDKDGKHGIDYTPLRKLKSPRILMLESLGATNNKRHGTYEEMYENIYALLQNAPGRVVVATFASQVERVRWIIDAAGNLGKKVALDGYSMKTNVELSKKLGYIKPKRGVLIDVKKIDNYHDSEIVVICTGGQGEERAVLNRIVQGDHRSIRFRKNDTVIFSSSIIPGNERTIQRLKDNIYRQCDNVYHGDVMDVHISGHATRQDIMEVIKMIQPDYFIPIYANHYFLKEAQRLAVKNGFDERKTVVPDNGTVIDFKGGKFQIQKQKAPSEYVFVDGLGISDSQHVVLRDRQVLAEDGMIVIIATVDTKTGDLIQNPDIISRGFVFLKDNRELIQEVRNKVKSMIAHSDPLSWADTNQIKNDIRDKIGQFIFSKTEKRPMVLPVVIEV
ncbi:ribonuclease J [Candidatus Nomurabacteria bacterium]|nr:ribonuclease J [Candidatus Nomurabacteria bacterium]